MPIWYFKLLCSCRSPSQVVLHALGAWMAPGNARRYLHALLKAKDLVAPAGPRAGICSDNTDVFSCTRSRHVLWWPWGQLGPQCFSSVSPYTRWQTVVPCTEHWSKWHLHWSAQQREGFQSLEHNWFLKAVSVCSGWSCYSFYQSFEELVLFTPLINRWLSALERGLLNSNTLLCAPNYTKMQRMTPIKMNRSQRARHISNGCTLLPFLEERTMNDASHLRHSGVQPLLFSTHSYRENILHLIHGVCLHIPFKHNYIWKLQTN